MELVEQKKDQLDSMLRLQNYLLECAEIKSQIQDKRKAIDSTQYVGSDLGGVLGSAETPLHHGGGAVCAGAQTDASAGSET